MKKLFCSVMLLCTTVLLFINFGPRTPALSSSDSKTLVPGDSFAQKAITAQKIILDPTGYAPLCALIKITTRQPVRLRVAGKNGPGSDVIKTFDSLKTRHSIPVFGLYAGHQNTVELTLSAADGKDLGTSSVRIATKPLHPRLPTLAIAVPPSGKSSWMTLVSYLAFFDEYDPRLPFMFDAYGDIRWYLDYSTSPVLNKLHFDNGPERLKNSNFYFGDMRTGAIYEADMFGKILHTWNMPGYSFHHKVIEKPDGNLLVCVSKKGAKTAEDHIVELDRKSGQIITTWDLRQSLQYSRSTQAKDTVDWIHVNGLEYDASDNTIIVSGRLQGVIKLDWSNQVIWILSPHRGWGIAGDGTDLRRKLLQPLDRKGQPIKDTGVLNGSSNHPDFEWNWYQHAAKPMPSGNLYLFDNGFNRNYVNAGPYSRAVEYKIDKTAGTVQQIWQYGKERGGETFSKVVSDLDYDPVEDHYIFSPGAIVTGGQQSGKVVEIDRKKAAVVFEATITPPAAFTGTITLHRTERMELYPN